MCDFNNDETEFRTKLSVVDEPRFIKVFDVHFPQDDKKDKVQKLELIQH